MYLFLQPTELTGTHRWSPGHGHVSSGKTTDPHHREIRLEVTDALAIRPLLPRSQAIYLQSNSNPNRSVKLMLENLLKKTRMMFLFFGVINLRFVHSVELSHMRLSSKITPAKNLSIHPSLTRLLELILNHTHPIPTHTTITIVRHPWPPSLARVYHKKCGTITADFSGDLMTASIYAQIRRVSAISVAGLKIAPVAFLSHL